VIDLHLHTTASDGRCTPEELISRAVAVGLRTAAVTDHDTMAAVEPAAVAAHAHGLELVPGIEITSVAGGKDVHVLGYFVDPRTPGLSETIADQRARRAARARAIADGLAKMGAPIDVDALLATAQERSGKAIARPQIAQALIAAGHASSVAEAFDRFLGEHSPAYVPHTGASPADVIRLIVAGGGIASFAHAGYTKQDHLIAGLVDHGLGAIEAFHSSHDESDTNRYLDMANRLGLVVTGGSDYHGEGVRRAEFFGVTHLPAHEYQRFLARSTRRIANAER